MYACARNVILATLSVALGLAAADPAIGTWKLNVAKSKYSPGPVPKSATVTYEVSGDGVKRTGETVTADGQTTSFSYTAQYDGKEYPVTGNPNADTIVLKRINDYTSESTLKKGGKFHRHRPTGRLQRWENSDADAQGHQCAGSKGQQRFGVREAIANVTSAGGPGPEVRFQQ
jgi:hypothetical protein